MPFERTYDQNQRILRIYSDFNYEKNAYETVYRTNEEYKKVISEYQLKRFFIYEDLYRNVSNLCRMIQLLAGAGKKIIINDAFTYNGFQLLKKCSGVFGLNCAGCAVVLNDILLTLGYKSKCICCIPYDEDNINTHVVVQVYDEQNKSWFVADPAFGAVPCDTSGRVMNILELREYISENAMIPYYQTGKLILQPNRCKKYADALIEAFVMFIVFKKSGLKYNFNDSKLVTPVGISKISDLYLQSDITNNAFFLFV